MKIRVNPKYLVSYCSNLYMGNITDADHLDAKRVCKDLETKNLGKIMICIVKAIHYYWLMLKLKKKMFGNIFI